MIFASKNDGPNNKGKTFTSFLAELVGFAQINRRLDQIENQIADSQRRIMDALQDLKTEVTALGQSVNLEISAAETALAAAIAKGSDGSVAASDVEAVVAQLATLRGTVDTATAKFGPTV